MRNAVAAGCVGLALALGLAACQRTPGEVADKVLMDFGIKKPPEGYTPESQKVFERLSAVAETEMKRLNKEYSRGEVKFQEEKGLRGRYYREVRVYTQFYPLDVRSMRIAAEQDTGYTGFIEYEYQVYRSDLKTNRTEAAAAAADLLTDETGRETYRYKFSSGGIWDGNEGRRTRQAK